MRVRKVSIQNLAYEQPLLSKFQFQLLQTQQCFLMCEFAKFQCFSLTKRKGRKKLLGPYNYQYLFRSGKNYCRKYINKIQQLIKTGTSINCTNFDETFNTLVDPLAPAAPSQSSADHLGVRGPQVENHWFISMLVLEKIFFWREATECFALVAIPCL